MNVQNKFGQPVGADLEGWVKPEFPSPDGLVGRSVKLVALNASSQAEPLFEAFAQADDSLWTYMGFGPFAVVEDLASAIDGIIALPDWQPYCILVDEIPVGFASYLRVDQSAGAIEIGSITFAPSLQQTTAATESIYLMIKYCFDLGYRRCEWKCDDLNLPSRSAALRLGFRYEGTFRQATHYKGRNRDTSWYAMTDTDWVSLEPGYVNWLAPENFDADGNQIQTLANFQTVSAS